MHIHTRHHGHEGCHICNVPYSKQHYLTSMSLLIDTLSLVQHCPHSMSHSHEATFICTHRVNNLYIHSLLCSLPHGNRVQYRSFCITNTVPKTPCLRETLSCPYGLINTHPMSII